MENGEIISNQEKYENYCEQFKRLNKALENGFNLEAMFIAYAILEDRTESVLRHAGLWEAYKKRYRSITLNSKISYIQARAESGEKLLKKYFSDSLLADILAWKEERNRLIHALLKQHLDHEEIRRYAVMGSELAKQMRSRTRSLNRAAERKGESHEH